MSRRIAKIKLDAFNGSNNGGYDGFYNLALPTGPTYREIRLNLTNIDIDQVTDVTLLLNGDPLIHATGQRLDLIREATGAHRDPKILVIPFTDTTQTPMNAQNWSELPTGPGENLVLKVRTAARKPAQANLVGTIEATAEMGPSRMVRTRLPRIIMDGLSATKTGINTYQNVFNAHRSGSKVWIQRLFLDNPNINNVKINQDRRAVFDVSQAENDFDLLSNGQVPVAGMYVYDAVMPGFSTEDAMPAIGRMEFEVDLSVASDFEIVQQFVELLPAPVQLRNQVA